MGVSVGERMGFGKVVGATLLEFGKQTSIAGIGNTIARKSYAKKNILGRSFCGNVSCHFARIDNNDSKLLQI